MTTRVVAQVHLPEAVPPAEREALARLLCDTDFVGSAVDGVVEAHAGAHLPLSVGGGALTWDLWLADEAALSALCERVRAAGSEPGLGDLGLAGDPSTAEAGIRAAIDTSRLELAIPEPIGGGIGAPGLVGVKRTLWLRVLPEAEPDAVARFERETPLLARAVPAIRNWCWSRIRTRPPSPMETRWTHLWEQEFDSAAGLEVDYMSAPCHWGLVDRWFDPEMPERVVDLWLAHLACPASAPVLGRAGEPASEGG